MKKNPHPVTPCMGVWIETIREEVTNEEDKSHPVWVCGLKHAICSHFQIRSLSHPVWVCGLKLEIIQSSELVRSHTLYGCVD